MLNSHAISDKSSCRQEKILFIGTVWPEPKSSAAGARLIWLMKFFFSQNLKVHFATGAEKSNFSEDLTGIVSQSHEINVNDSDFDTFISELNPQIVVFDRFMMEEQFGWRVRENCPNALTILDTEDLHFLRIARMKAEKSGENYENFLYEEETKRELASILRCDLSLIISKFELNLLQETFKIPHEILFYLPLLMETKAFESKNFAARKDFIFIGNMKHPPNADAVFYLKQKIWDGIKKAIPEANLKIYGSYLPQKIQELHKEKDGFLICGRAEEVSEVMSNARVLLSPLRFGAGQKGKFVEAMQYELPTITTIIGAEGMSEANLWNGFICENEEEIIEKAIKLYSNEQIWNESVLKAKSILKSEFNSKEFEDKLRKQLDFLEKNRDHHRKNNFIGQILHLNQVNSYKYMSKWIEEKSKVE